MSDTISTRDPSDPDHDRLERIDDVLLAYLQQRNQGEEVNNDELIARYPDLMPELKEQLSLLSEVSNASDVAVTDHGLSPAVSAPRWPGSGAIRIRCPHCYQPVEVVPDAPFTDITCNGCGSHFSLAGDERETRASRSSTQLGHFELVERLGLGSFGTVWKARDTQLDRTVAIKIPRQGKLDSEEVESFLREARAAAQLSHPNIVSVHEIGRDDDTVYIVSDLVRGVPLSDWVTGKQPTFREAAELCAKIAEALQHAHEAGVVHRDLKPQNVMIDAVGQPHLMDFGLARRVVGEITMTLDGQVLGTPAYMSPEQARGEAHRADRRTDVYSLGVILFELLTGELPFRGNARMMLHQVLKEDPPSPRKLQANVPKDLETICLKCLEKDVSNRYSSAEDVRNDLRCFLSNEPISARPLGVLQRSWRWCKRRPLAATTVLLIVLVAVAAALVAVNRTQLLTQARDAARDSKLQQYISDINVVSGLLQEGDVDRAHRILMLHADQTGDDYRGIEWHWLAQLCQGDEIRTYPMPNAVQGVSVSFDGLVAVACVNEPDRSVANLVAGGSHSVLGNLVVCETLIGETRVLRSGRNPPSTVMFSPDGQTLVTGKTDGSIDIWTGRPLQHQRSITTSHKKAVSAISFSPGGDMLATGSSDGTLVLWRRDDQTLDLRGDWDLGFPILALCFNRSGNSLAAAGRATRIVTIDDVNRPSLRSTNWPIGWIRSLAFSPDHEDQLYVGNVNTFIKRLNIRTGEIDSVGQHRNVVSSLAFLSNGRILASAGSWDKSIRLWDSESKQPLGVLKGHRDSVRQVVVTPDGSRMYSGSSDKTVKVWNAAAASNSDIVTQLSGWALAVSFSGDGERLVSGSNEQLCVHDVETQRPLHAVSCEGLRTLAVHPLKGFIVVGTDDGDVEIWDDRLDEQVTIGEKVHEGRVFRVAISPSGNYFVSTDDHAGEVIVWNGETLAREARFEAHDTGVSTATFAPDGQMVVTGGGDGSVRLWRVPSGEKIREFSLMGSSVSAPIGNVIASAISRDGSMLAVGGGGRIIVWELDSTIELQTMPLNAGTDESLTFSQDGRTLISGYMNSTIKLWNVQTGRELMTLRGHEGFLQATDLSPNGQILASASADGTIRLWPSLKYRQSAQANNEEMEKHAR